MGERCIKSELRSTLRRRALWYLGLSAAVGCAMPMLLMADEGNGTGKEGTKGPEYDYMAVTVCPFCGCTGYHKLNSIVWKSVRCRCCGRLYRA
jgi:hypothetical protein